MKLYESNYNVITYYISNYMKLNGDKCHLILSGYKHEAMWPNIGQVQIWESKKQKVLGVIIDRT